jgi:hypothetical protein
LDESAHGAWGYDPFKYAEVQLAVPLEDFLVYYNAGIGKICGPCFLTTPTILWIIENASLVVKKRECFSSLDNDHTVYHGMYFSYDSSNERQE